MNKKYNKLTFIGIETSCDETAVSIVRLKPNNTGTILSNIVSSQVDIHKKFGGVVPELAARAHVQKIERLTKIALTKSKMKWKNINAIAATAGPGLIVCLTIGMCVGKAIAGTLKKPFLAINHLEGHALSPRIKNKINFPYLLLLISGGHTQFIEVKGVGKYKRLGTTIDDALGEAFDKTAKILGIKFPGGPILEKWAEKGNKKFYDLPKPIPVTGFNNKTYLINKSGGLTLSMEDIININNSIQTRNHYIY